MRTYCIFPSVTVYAPANLKQVENVFIFLAFLLHGKVEGTETQCVRKEGEGKGSS